MPQRLAHGVDVHAAPESPAGEGMTQVVNLKIGDARCHHGLVEGVRDVPRWPGCPSGQAIRLFGAIS